MVEDALPCPFLFKSALCGLISVMTRRARQLTRHLSIATSYHSQFATSTIYTMEKIAQIVFHSRRQSGISHIVRPVRVAVIIVVLVQLPHADAGYRFQTRRAAEEGLQLESQIQEYVVPSLNE